MTQCVDTLAVWILLAQKSNDCYIGAICTCRARKAFTQQPSTGRYYPHGSNHSAHRESSLQQETHLGNRQGQEPRQNERQVLLQVPASLRTKRANSARVVQFDGQCQQLRKGPRKERGANGQDDTQALNRLVCTFWNRETLEERGQHGVDDRSCAALE